MNPNGDQESRFKSEYGNKTYEFGSFRLDAIQRLLFRDGELIHLPPKSFELLAFFVEYPNQVIEKEKLLREVWPDAFVEDANLSVHISSLRKVLGARNGDANGNSQVKIETFPKVGYRFCADVTIGRSERSGLDDLALNSAPEKVGFFRNNHSIALIVLLAATGVFMAAFYYLFRPSAGVRFSEKSTAVVRSTNVGRVFFARVSPDGKYLVYGRQDDDGRFSVWLKLVGSSSETEVVPPIKGQFYGARFLPDGKSIVYTARLPDQSAGAFVMPILGGSSTRLPLTGALDIVYSPGGERLAYLWNELSAGKTHLMLANSDGTNARSVSVRQAPNYYWTAVGLSWSPDGRRIICVAQNSVEGFPRIVEIDVETGLEKQLTDRAFATIRGLAWLGDGSGIIMCAAEENSSLLQIWHLSYPDMKPTKITNDTASYDGMSLSGDDRVLVTTERKRQSSIWVAPVTDNEGDLGTIRVDTSAAVKISNSTLDGADTQESYGGVAWTPDGRLVFTSEEAGNGDIWIMNADGSSRRQLTTDRRKDTGPSVSPDGKTIAFMSYRDGTESIWLMDIDGGNQRRFIHDMIERVPTFSPDGKWIYFGGWRTGKACIWRMPIEGGDMENVVSEPSFWHAFSRDGRWLLYSDATGQWNLHDLISNEPERKLALGANAQWGPIPNVFSYVDYQEPDKGNVWIKNIESGEKRKLTEFADLGVYRHRWSPDGKKIALVRQLTESDVVVMTAN